MQHCSLQTKPDNFATFLVLAKCTHSSFYDINGIIFCLFQYLLVLNVLFCKAFHQKIKNSSCHGDDRIVWLHFGEFHLISVRVNELPTPPQCGSHHSRKSKIHRKLVRIKDSNVRIACEFHTCVRVIRVCFFAFAILGTGWLHLVRGTK